MAFPPGHLDLAAEMYIDDAWTDITGDVLERDQIQITRGRSDEAQDVQASRATLTLDNRSDKYSPRNPMGTWYGKIGRNTPVRISRPGTSVRLETFATVGIGASAPDSAALSITSDIDLRVNASLADWVTDSAPSLLGKGGVTTWSYVLYTNNGKLLFFYTTDGTSATSVILESTATLPQPWTGRKSIRVAFDANNGAGGKTATFYYSTDTNLATASWTQLGTPVTSAGTATMYDSTATLRVVGGGQPGLYVYSAEVRSSIGGTVVANPNFEAQTSGATSFADTAGSPNTWTVGSAARLTNLRVRLVGEASAFPQEWDPTRTDRYVRLEVFGILRRLSQGTPALQSVYYRQAVRMLSDQLIAYWPAEDGTTASVLGSALEGGRAMTVTSGADFASNSDFPGSRAIPVVNESRWVGTVQPYTDTGAVTLRFLVSFPASTPNNAVVAAIYCLTSRWSIYYQTGGLIGVKVTDSSGTSVYDSGGIAFGATNVDWVFELQLDEGATTTAWALNALSVNRSTPGGISASAPITIGRATQVIVNPGSVDLGDLAIGQIYVLNSVGTSLTDTQVNGYSGETATDRIVRLCEEEGIALSNYSNGLASTVMGVQGTSTLLTLLKEAADADAGILFESRYQVGLAWRSRTSLYNQTPDLTFDYVAHQLTGLNPVEDDQLTRNDITVSRPNGASARFALASGPMSTQQPPDGVGLYDDAREINVAYDSDLPDQAGWRLHLGTIDEPRYPLVDLNFGNTSLTSIVDTVLDAEIGDRVVIQNPPIEAGAPDDISQLLQGYFEQMGAFTHTMTLNLSPESPYRVATYSATPVATGSKYSSDGTTVRTVMTSTQTTINLATPAGPLWTTAAAEYPFDVMIAGEQITVGGCTGTTSTTQQFTSCTRSVNGVVKTHAVGETVALYQPAIYAL